MAPYNIFPAVDENYTFPPRVVQGLFANLTNDYPSLKPPLSMRLSNDTNLNSLLTTGRYLRQTSAPSGMNYPEGAVHGYLDVMDMEPGSSRPYRAQIWTETWGSFIAVRRYYTGGWTNWVKYEPMGTLPERVKALEEAESTSISGVRSGEHELRLNALRQRIGLIPHPGKATVAFICDHGSLAFQSIILPKLRQHKMKATLAMCSTQLGLEPANEVSNWSTVGGWATSDNIEIACHSKTHADVSGVGSLREEIITSRDELSSNLGGLPIDSWVQPGARNVINTSVGAYDGFNNGSNPTRYFSSAGEMIWNGYAVATGQASYKSSRVFPCTGEPPLGPNRRFLDKGQSDIDLAKSDIAEAIATGGRCIVSVHPAYIRTDGRTDNITKAQIESFIDYLANLVTTGKIVMAQLREWGIVGAPSN